MRILVGLLCSCVLSLSALAQAPTQRLTPKALLGGAVQVLVPAGFDVMSPELLHFKYPSERRPTLVYTNAAGSVNLALHHTPTPVEPTQLAQVHASMEALFRQRYPSAQWFQSGLVQINGRTFFLLDLRTPALDTEIRNMMVGTALQGRLLLISFNATKALEAGWVPVGRQILASIRLGG